MIFALRGAFRNVWRHTWLSKVGGTTSICRVESRDAAKHPTLHRTAPTPGNYPATDVTSAERLNTSNLRGGREPAMLISTLREIHVVHSSEEKAHTTSCHGTASAMFPFISLLCWKFSYHTCLYHVKPQPAPAKLTVLLSFWKWGLVSFLPKRKAHHLPSCFCQTQQVAVWVALAAPNEDTACCEMSIWLDWEEIG